MTPDNKGAHRPAMRDAPDSVTPMTMWKADRPVHQTIPVRVWADTDEGIVDMVLRLNEMPGVRTHASCQGTIGEGGPHPYPGHVMAHWANDDALEQIRREYNVILEGSNFGYVIRKGTKWKDRP